jgi:membrane-associated phospholipid phosphatase
VTTEGNDQPPTLHASAAADALADRLAATGNPAWQQLAAGLHQASELDHAVYEAIATVDTPALDGPARHLSRAADKSRLWLAIAAVLAAAGGPAGRRAALRGVLAIGVSSAVVNLGVKTLSDRRRPDRTDAGVPSERYVRMPGSTSFPSGHSASAFAFASAVGRDVPALALPLNFLATAVAYSRVHTGVHYPSDTIVGALIGASTAYATGAISDRYAPATGPLSYLAEPAT